MRFQKPAYFFISTLGIILILIYGQNLLIPFVLGLLLWFLMRRLKINLNRIQWINHYFPNWLKEVLSFGIVFIVISGIFNIITSNINSLRASFPSYEANIDGVIQQINTRFNINIVGMLQEQAGAFDFSSLLSSIFSSISDVIGNTFMILLYAAFILLEETYFSRKLKNLFSNPSQYEQFNTILSEIEASISNYFGLKAFVSLLTGGLSLLALWIIGVDSPAFWAFLIFILNFIPTIGSLIGTIFPAVFALLQFGELTPCLLILGIVGLIQVIVGNIIEPRLMGSSMNISPLVTILALSIWGAIWGITGMILSVPITVVLILVCSHFESTKSVAIMLSEKGQIHQK